MRRHRLKRRGANDLQKKKGRYFRQNLGGNNDKLRRSPRNPGRRCVDLAGQKRKRSGERISKGGKKKMSRVHEVKLTTSFLSVVQ